MDLLGSIMGSMDKPPTPSQREKKMQKALQAKSERRLEAEQQKRAKFKVEAEESVKKFVEDDKKTELPFPKLAKVYRAILHEVAEAAGLYSHSIGDGDEKDLVITKAPAAVETPNQKPKSPVEDCVSTVTNQTTPTAASPVSDYRQKYQHLIGGLDCAEKTAVRMEPNKSFGYVPSANKRDHRSIEETMNDLKTRKKPKLDPSLSEQSHTPHDIAHSSDAAHVDHTS